jgi:hypothetical protein
MRSAADAMAESRFLSRSLLLPLKVPPKRREPSSAASVADGRATSRLTSYEC